MRKKYYADKNQLQITFPAEAPKAPAPKLKPSPVLKQYNSVKQEYPGVVLLFRTGNFFYEAYQDDAKTVAVTCGTNITTKGGKNAESYFVTGFPFTSLDNNLTKLIRAGYRVALVRKRD